jgi:hypothetical protein
VGECQPCLHHDLKQQERATVLEIASTQSRPMSDLRHAAINEQLNPSYITAVI